MREAAPRPDDALEYFASAVFDHQALARRQVARWSTLRAATKTFWREGIARAAAAAAASQRSALTGEPIVNAAEPNRVMALELAALSTQVRSRATTSAGRRKWRGAHGADLELIWIPAVRAGRRAVLTRWSRSDLPALDLDEPLMRNAA